MFIAVRFARNRVGGSYLQQFVFDTVFSSRKNVGCSAVNCFYASYQHRRPVSPMKRPISHTYLFLTKKFKKCEKISLRKQVCLQYLRWGMTKYRDDRIKFVDLAILWRKEERKLGSIHRTLIEKKARLLIPQVRKDKNSIRQVKVARKVGLLTHKLKIGVHSPEQVESKIKYLLQNRKVTAHWWIVYPPEGEPMKIYNLKAFCREHGLRQNHMVATAVNPSGRKYHKGWRAEKWDPSWEKAHKDG
jgi:hypothetical protein